MRPSILIPLAVTLLAIWSIVGMVMHATDEYISSPEKVAALVNEAPWRHGGKPTPEQRKTYLDRLAQLYRMLNFEQRRRMRENDTNGEMMFFIAELTDEERKTYLRTIFEAEFQPLMKAWPNISKEDRRKFIGASRNEMRKQGRDTGSLEALTGEDDKVFEKLIDGSIADYYSQGNEKRKVNLAPLMEELQLRVQGIRRR